MKVRSGLTTRNLGKERYRDENAIAGPRPGTGCQIESARTAPSISRSHLFVLLFNHDQTHDIYTSCRFSTLDARSDDEELDSKAPLDQNVIKFDPR